MTPTRQAGSFLLAGLVSLLSASARGEVPQPSTPQQTAAPIVRVHPHPPTTAQPRPQAATVPARAPARTASPPANPAATAKAAPPAASGGTPTHPASVEHKFATPTISATGLNRDVIVLDPAHGGADSGARIGDSILEKNVTLALAFRLRSLLTARGFTVVLTRDSDAATEPNSPSTALTLDDRAGIANHARAAACLLLHATGRGTGIHLYSSELTATPGEASLVPWLTAQSAWVPASQVLEQQMGAALGRSHIALLSSSASVRPLDSLTCPALVVELAPEDEGPNSVNDAGYQERVASAIVGALVFWKNAVQQPSRIAAPAPPAHTVRHTPAIPAVKQEAQP